MIFTRTPLRISLAGGGTDMPSFYNTNFGAVVSFAINKYVYVGVNERFTRNIRVSYSKTELVSDPSEIKHDLIRECMLEYHVKGVEVVTIADVPGSGTGLGSSSSLTVGLVRALSGFLTPGTQFHPHDLAEKAFEIERGRCGYSVGRQDHFAAACGGLNYFRFEQDRTIVESLQLSEKLLRELQSHFVLLWTGTTRKAGELLEQQEIVLGGRPEVAVEMRDIAVRMSNDLRNGVIENIGEMLDANWQRKKQLADGITNDWIDKKYNQAIEAGAEGGKLCGAGGGGFLLFYAPFGKKNALEKATGLRAINFEIEPKGSEILWQK